MPNFVIDTSLLLSGESIFAIIFAFLLFTIVPILLCILEYKLTKKDKKQGIILLISVYASSILFGLFSIMIGLVLTLINFLANRTRKLNSQTL